MKKLAFIMLACVSALAQAQTPSKEQMLQMQEMMARQMQVMAAMYDLRHARQGVDETVASIRAAAQKRGWHLGEVVDMQAQMRKSGAGDARPMKVVSLCPEGANARVAKASGGKAPPLACRATVFEGKDGRTNVVRLNLHTLAKGMRGDLAKVLGELAAEEDALYQGILD